MNFKCDCGNDDDFRKLAAANDGFEIYECQVCGSLTMLLPAIGLYWTYTPKMLRAYREPETPMSAYVQKALKEAGVDD